MAKIQVLDKHVAELIAAGEVCERPSSVVKELVENSIDAKASVITVEIKNGGITYLRVTDNGSGIEQDSVKTAFLRHATSKISSEDDLEHILTLGFRGEALASIAAVSRVQMMTKTEGSLAGTEISLEGGEIISFGEAGCPQGTTIIVKDLFYNTPARMKFLKKDVSEANSVCGVVEKIALSHPEISFRVLRDNREYLNTPGDGKLLSAIYSVLGKNVAKGMLPVEYTFDCVKVSGFVSKPEQSRANRTLQNFFINGRFVKSRTCAAALEQAYKHAIMVQKFPACVLMVEMPAELVDVNVHPAKIEVRFVQEKMVFDAVFHAVKNTLSKEIEFESIVLKEKPSVPQEKIVPPQQMSLGQFKAISALEQIHQEGKGEPISFSSGSSRPYKEMFFDNGSLHGIGDSFTKRKVPVEISHEEAKPSSGMQRFSDFLQKKEGAQFHFSNSHQKRQETPPNKETPPQSMASKAADINGEEKWFHMIGEAFGTYLLVERGEELLLIDKHAAHERILFNHLRATDDASNSQVLLEPLMISLSAENYATLLTELDILSTLGIEAEDFGSKTLLVRAMPMYLEEDDIQELLEELAGKLSGGVHDLTPEKLDDLYHSVACRSAIKAHDKSTPMEMERIVQTILFEDDVRYCPHGRPVAITLKRSEIEKKFGRQ